MYKSKAMGNAWLLFLFRLPDESSINNKEMAVVFARFLIFMNFLTVPPGAAAPLNVFLVAIFVDAITYHDVIYHQIYSCRPSIINMLLVGIGHVEVS